MALEWQSRGQGFDSPHLHGGVAAKNGCLFAGIAQLVEHNLAKVGVAGSSPVSRSGNGRFWGIRALGRLERLHAGTGRAPQNPNALRPEEPVVPTGG